jgi:hypothetical protein
VRKVYLFFACLPLILVGMLAVAHFKKIGLEFSPVFLPVKVKVEADGDLVVEEGSVATPIGTFSPEQDALNNRRLSPGKVLLIIRHPVRSMLRDTGFEIETRSDIEVRDKSGRNLARGRDHRFLARLRDDTGFEIVAKKKPEKPEVPFHEAVDNEQPTEPEASATPEAIESTEPPAEPEPEPEPEPTPTPTPAETVEPAPTDPGSGESTTGLPGGE